MSFEQVYNLLEEFAIGNPRVLAVFEGIDPEEGMKAFYLLTGRAGYDDDFQDKISDLDIGIAEKTNCTCSVFEWPITLEQSSDYSFLENCV